MTDDRRLRAEAARLANDVVDRFTTDTAGKATASSTRSPPESPSRSSREDPFVFRELRAGLDRALDANVAVLRLLVDATADVAERAWRTSRLGDLATGRQRDGAFLTLPPVMPGRIASSTLWVHNTTGAAAGPLTLVATPLVGRLGGFIGPDNLSLDPSAVAALSAASSAPVAVELRVARDVAPDRYEGRIVIPEMPDEPLFVVVDVVTAG